MVDSIKGSGQVQNIQSANKAQEARERTEKRAGEARTEPQDEVSISIEAIDKAQAEQAARDARQALEDNRHLSLSQNNDLDQDA